MASLGDNVGLLFRIKSDYDGKGVREAKGDVSDLGKAGSLAGSGFASMVNPAALALAAVAAIGAAAVTAAVGLFNLTKSASDAGSEIFDASQKTGLSAQTLSALKYAAEQSGSSFEQVTGAVAKFNVLLGEANLGNAKASDTLAKFGITVRETDGALKQAIETIAKETDVTIQAATAKALFKDRTADILPVIQSFNGDLPGLIAHLEKLGLVMTDENARAADEFGDTLDTLEKQAAAVGRQFAFELMPSITSAMQNISAFMVENQGVATTWANTTMDAARGVGVAYTAVSNVIQEALTGVNLILLATTGQVVSSAAVMRTALESLITPLFLLIQLGRQFGSSSSNEQYGPFASDMSPVPLKLPSGLGGSGGGGRARGGGGGGGSGGKSDAAQKAKKELDNLIELERLALKRLEKEYNETMRRVRDAFKENRDQGLFSADATAAVEKFTAGVIEARGRLLKLSDQAAEGETSTALRVRLRKHYDEVISTSDRITKDSEENNKLRTDDDKKRAEEVKKLLKEIEDFAIQSSDAIHDDLIKNADEELKTAIDYYVRLVQNVRLTKKQRIEADNELREVLSRNYNALTIESNARFENGIIALDKWKREKSAEIETTIKDEELRKAALEQVNAEYKTRLDLKTKLHNEEKQDIAAKTAEQVTPSPEYSFGIADQWKDFKESVKEEGPSIGATLQSIGQMGFDAFKSIADGIGSAVHAWVLYGTAGPQAMKKMVASVLAGVAAQSAVLAIFELAKGFAALFFNPGEAAAHFQAAALFGSLAVGAALGGRAVAGDSFKQQTEGGGAGSGAGLGEDNGNKPGLVFTERFAGFEQRIGDLIGKATDRINEVTGAAGEAMQNFADKFGPVTPGHVVMAGAGDAGGQIFDAVTEHIGSDLRASSDLTRSQGRYR